MKKSKGHICFGINAGNSTEFYQRDNEVYRAPVGNPIMPDGYRCGRWECSIVHFHRFEQVILSGFDQVLRS